MRSSLALLVVVAAGAAAACSVATTASDRSAAEPAEQDLNVPQLTCPNADSSTTFEVSGGDAGDDASPSCWPPSRSDAGEAGAAVPLYAEVKPIIDETCGHCHNGAFSSLEKVKRSRVRMISRDRRRSNAPIQPGMARDPRGVEGPRLPAEQLRASLIVRVDRAGGAFAALSSASAVVIEKHFSIEACDAWVRGVYGARDAWTHDFGGEQFSLGRAFYTHLEEGKSRAYFADAAASDARVEAHAPGLQHAMRDLVASVVGETPIQQRRGWCGPGVHIFPPGGPVASVGGVTHFDTEGLPAHHVQRRCPAITLVAMFQATETEGGLRVWDVLYDGHDHPTYEELGKPSSVVTYRTGDVVLIDSYRLHQIQPFEGARERISATVHAARIDPGRWECWF